MDSPQDNNKLPNTLDFSNANILVIGDIMLDRYWHGDTTRISPEAPVPVVNIEEIDERLGGSANVASNIAALGANAKLIGIVGYDEAAEQLKSLLDRHEIAHDLIQENVKTCTKLRIMGRSQQLIRCDFEQDYSHCQDNVLLTIAKHLDWADAVVLSDYAKGTLSGVEEIIQLIRQKSVPILVDPKSDDFSRYAHATMITPNQHEFEVVAGKIDVNFEAKAKALQAQHHIDALLVTQGAQGMSLFDKDAEPLHVPALAREVYDITGAGDTVIATLSCALAQGLPFSEAANLANVAASLVVAKLGTSYVTMDELQKALYQQSHPNHRKILSEQELIAEIESLRHQGKIISMTNGCFDIIHAGHVTYLEKAKSFGDVLILAINDDSSVKRLKGEARPIYNLHQRMQILAALECVDWVVSFSQDTPLSLIESIKPDVLVKGADYKIEEVVGGSEVMANGGRVELVEMVKGCSTTSTLSKVNELAV